MRFLLPRIIQAKPLTKPPSAGGKTLHRLQKGMNKHAEEDTVKKTLPFETVS